MNELTASPRPIDRYFTNYGADHRHPTNTLIHWICVPAILWSVIALSWLIPVPERIGRPGLWAAVLMFFAFLWYYRHSRVIGLGMAIAFVALSLATEALFRLFGGQGLLYLAIAVFVVAWIGQFIGHTIEGAKPSFFTDLFYLLVGPAWLLSKFLRRIGIAW